MSDGKDPSGGGNSAPARRPLKRPIEEVRAELLADPDVREQARMLRLPVAQYVEKILDYAQNPQKPPQVQLVADEVLKAKDPSIPTAGEIKTYLEKVASGEIPISPAHKKDGFEASKDGARGSGRYEQMMGNAKARKDAPEQAPSEPTDTPYKLPK
jgi:hypothetical protein